MSEDWRLTDEEMNAIEMRGIARNATNGEIDRELVDAQAKRLVGVLDRQIKYLRYGGDAVIDKEVWLQLRKDVGLS